MIGSARDQFEDRRGLDVYLQRIGKQQPRAAAQDEAPWIERGGAELDGR